MDYSEWVRAGLQQGDYDNVLVRLRVPKGVHTAMEQWAEWLRSAWSRGPQKFDATEFETTVFMEVVVARLSVALSTAWKWLEEIGLKYDAVVYATPPAEAAATEGR